MTIKRRAELSQGPLGGADRRGDRFGLRDRSLMLGMWLGHQIVVGHRDAGRLLRRLPGLACAILTM